MEFSTIFLIYPTPPPRRRPKRHRSDHPQHPSPLLHQVRRTHKNGAGIEDHEIEMRKAREDLNRRIHDDQVAREIMKIPEDECQESGELFAKPFGKGSSSSSTTKRVESESVFRLYFKGLVSEEMVGNERMVLAGVGVALCDSRDNLVFEVWKPLIGNGMSKNGAQLKALIEGLNAALALDLKRIAFFFANVAGQRRRQQAITIGKERRESLVRAKRLCRVGTSGDPDVPSDSEMMIDEDQSILEAQTSSAVEELKSAVAYQGKGALQKKVSALRELRRLLSRSEFPPVEAALKAGAIPLLVQCLSFGSPDEQLLEAAWCLTNIAAGKPEETKALLPALPLLVAHLGEKSSLPVAEQCAWALGNVAGEGEELRNILLSQGALPPLARMMLPDKGSTVRTAAWALSNLIKGPNPKAAAELIRVDGVLDAIIRHLRKADDELATEVAWVVVYLSALSNLATSMLVKSDVLQLLVERLATSNSLQLLIPVLRSLGNLIAGDSQTTHAVIVPGHEVTGNVIEVLVKCLNSEHRVLKKEAAWVLSNIAAGSIEHKRLIYSSEAVPLLLRLLSTAPFDIRKEVAYVLGNLCVSPISPTEGDGKPNLILEHLVSLVGRGCLPGFIDLVNSADTEAARLGLQFTELVLRGMPNGEGPKLVEKENGIEAMERFQFHENEDLRNMANSLVDRYFGEDYGLDE